MYRNNFNASANLLHVPTTVATSECSDFCFFSFMIILIEYVFVFYYIFLCFIIRIYKIRYASIVLVIAVHVQFVKNDRWT